MVPTGPSPLDALSGAGVPKVWGVFFETARFFGKRGVAAGGLAEALRSEALKTRESVQKSMFFFAARGERQAQRQGP